MDEFDADLKNNLLSDITNYYQIMSLNKLIVSGDSYEVILPNDKSHFNAIGNVNRAAIKYADFNLGIDFSKYDGNGDSELDVLCIVHREFPSEWNVYVNTNDNKKEYYTGIARLDLDNNIQSLAGTGTISVDGITINEGVTVEGGGIQLKQYVGPNLSIRNETKYILAHELNHKFDYKNGHFSAPYMSSMGLSPDYWADFRGMNSYERNQIGWLKFTRDLDVVGKDGKRTIYLTEGYAKNGEAARIKINGSSYILIENRKRISELWGTDKQGTGLFFFINGNLLCADNSTSLEKNSYKTNYNYVINKYTHEMKGISNCNVAFEVTSPYTINVYYGSQQFNGSPSKIGQIEIMESDNHPKITIEQNREPDIKRYYLYRNNKFLKTINHQIINAWPKVIFKKNIIDKEIHTSVKQDLFEYYLFGEDSQGKFSPKSDIVRMKGFKVKIQKTNKNNSGENNLFEIFQNYPNPFNTNTIISYQLFVSGYISIKIYNSLGEKVTDLVEKVQINGRHIVNFDGSNLNSGVYYCTMRAGGFTITKKILLIK